jgi:hypothetical protein
LQFAMVARMICYSFNMYLWFDMCTYDFDIAL